MEWYAKLSILFETPYRQLIRFSPFDSGLGDANLLIMAKSGGGKTFMTQEFLLMMARAKPLISILERGDSYKPLVELMGGRVINVDLDGKKTLNPWDLPIRETVPSNEKTAFLKNLTSHLIGESPGADTALLDSVLTDAIPMVYKRCAIRYSSPVPTFNDLREELANWRDAEKVQRIRIKRVLPRSNCAREQGRVASMRISLTDRPRCAWIAIGSSSM